MFLHLQIFINWDLQSYFHQDLENEARERGLLKKKIESRVNIISNFYLCVPLIIPQLRKVHMCIYNH